MISGIKEENQCEKTNIMLNYVNFYLLHVVGKKKLYIFAALYLITPFTNCINTFKIKSYEKNLFPADDKGYDSESESCYLH